MQTTILNMALSEQSLGLGSLELGGLDCVCTY